jgi:Spy/CpxP family protein refolding chaperone
MTTKTLFRMIQMAVMVALLISVETRTANAQSGHTQQATPQLSGDQTLPAQLRELRAKVARLEATLGENPQGKAPPSTDAAMGGMEMGESGQPSGMGMRKQESMGMPGMGAGMSSMTSGSNAGGASNSGRMGAGMMGMRHGRRGMEMMGSMGTAAGMPMSSALPGFPGASHLYHVGATGFFLDHPEHIRLTMEQQTALSRIKEKALLEQTTAQRKIEGAEQELWTLTGADQPAADKVEAKVREIEKLRADQRLAFIRAVGEAVQVLTDEQRKALLGQIPPTAPSTPQGTPNMGTGMKDDM